MPFIDSGGVNIYYEAGGQGEPLILIMGFGQNLMHWADFPMAMVKQQYQVILIDNRGTGRSDKPDAPVTMVQMADDVVKVMDALKISRANVFGVSMGGMIVQEFALNHGDRLLNLILGCTLCGGVHTVAPEPDAQKILFDLEYLKSLTPEQRSKTVFSFLCTQEYIDQNPDALKYYHQVTNEYVTPEFIFKRQGEAVALFDTWDRLTRIKAPTMIIAGTADRLIPYKNSEVLKERIPGSELVLLQDKGHFFHVEALDSTRIFVNGFLKRHSKH